jgi:predicted phosphodiesterase
MKILVISDHEEKLLYDHFDPSRWVGHVDLTISCGDLSRDYLSYLVTVLGVPLLYVAGNHDARFRVQPPDGCDDISGKFVRVQGIRIAGIAGSLRYNADGEKFQYTEWEMRRKIWRLTRAVALARGVDIVVSHAAPHRCPMAPKLCSVPAGLGFACNRMELIGHPDVCPEAGDACHRAVPAFDSALRHWKPRWWLHGHNHIEYGRIPRLWWVGQTQVINADGHIVLDTEQPVDIKSGSMVIGA